MNGEFDVVAIPGVGNPKDFTGIDVKGKVALISRGDIAFVDKIANAKAVGAKAVLIHNSQTERVHQDQQMYSLVTHSNSFLLLICLTQKEKRFAMH